MRTRGFRARGDGQRSYTQSRLDIRITSLLSTLFTWTTDHAYGYGGAPSIESGPNAPFPRAPISTSHLQFFDKQWVDQTIRQEVTCLAVGGGYVVVGTSARSIGQKYIAEIWSLNDGIADDDDPRCGADEADAPSFLRFAVGHREPIYACAAEAGRIATGGDDCTVRFWEPSSITRLLGPGMAAAGANRMAAAGHKG